jgi:hypothetical protein
MYTILGLEGPSLDNQQSITACSGKRALGTFGYGTLPVYAWCNLSSSMLT